MRKFSVIAIALLVCVVAAPVFAWEFSMNGAFVMEYRYATQLGTNGFFGPFDLVPAVPGFAEAPNFWHGIHFRPISGQDLVYSSDAATHATWLDIAPQIRINKAVRIRGTYRVGAHAAADGAAPGADNIDPVNFNTINTGMLNSFGVGQWDLLWATAQTPWGIIALGKRPFAFGCGMYFDGTINTTTESVGFVVPYGPFTFIIGFFPGRTDVPAFYRPMNRANKSDGIRDWQWAYALKYGAGPMELGSFGTYIQMSAVNAGGNTGAAAPLVLLGASNLTAYVSTNYIKYANGRFFMNAEAGWHAAEVKTENWTPSYTENWRMFVEAGALAGPVKFGAIGALSTGGSYADKSYSSTLPNTVVFKPYSLLMLRNYGVGTAFSSTAYEGYLDNAYFLGTRVDYAVATNLNVWAAFAAAWRWDRRTEMKGCINLGGTAAQPNGQVDFSSPTAGTSGDDRWIPNDDLGWEIYGGLDWKLLEGLRVQVDTAYWQPGDWFKHACVSSNSPAGVAGMYDVFGANRVNINPYRSIDPVLAFWLSANFEY